MLAGWSAYNQPTADRKPDQNQLPTTTLNQNTTAASVHSLVVYEKTDEARRIQVLRDLGSHQTAVVFTDSDEPLMLIDVGNIAAETDELVVLMAERTNRSARSIWFVKLDGSGQKRQVATNYPGVAAPQTDSTATKLVYAEVLVNNRVVRYAIVQLSVSDGSTTILREEAEPVTAPVFSSDGTEIYYVSAADHQPAIVGLTLASQATREIVRTDKRVPFDLTTGPGRSFAFIDRTGATDQLIEVAADNTLVNLPTPAGNIRKPVYSQNGQELAYLALIGNEASIRIYHKSTATTKEVPVGLQPIGWIAGE